MFTFVKLGELGRFGNQLFQIAATIGMAARHGQDYIFPEWPPSVYFREPIPQTTCRLRPDVIIGQRAFHYLDLRISTNASCLIELRGFFQAERHFLHAADLVRTHFAPHPAIVEQIERQHGDTLRRHPSCIIVVRRGDYAEEPLQHPMMPAAYYEEAMGFFPPGTPFFVTSDEIDWCRKNIRGANVTYLPQDEWWVNFFIGTMCRNAIISNTTFGWWIGWLNAHAEKRVIAPKQWFGPEYAHHRTDDLLPEEWVRL